MATNQLDKAFSATVSTEYVSVEILEFGERALRNCAWQRNDAAVTIEENQALTHGRAGTKSQLSLETLGPRRV